MDIFLSISFNRTFGCSKEPSHRDDSFEFSQHMFWLKNNENDFKYTLWSWHGFATSDLFLYTKYYCTVNPLYNDTVCSKLSLTLK